MNEIILNNQFNEVIFKDFRQVDFDLFVAACVVTRKNERADIHITGSQMRKVLNVPTYNKPAFKTALISGVRTIRGAYYENTDKGIDTFNIFERFHYSEDNDDLHIKFTDSGHQLILGQDYFFIANLADYNALSTFYIKRLFLLLKQFRTAQKHSKVAPRAGVHMEWNAFRAALQIPESYDPYDIDRRILKKAKLQFDKIGVFKNMKTKKEYSDEQGRPITAITITFDPEDSSTFTDDLKPSPQVPICTVEEVVEEEVAEVEVEVEVIKELTETEKKIQEKQAKVDDLNEKITALRDVHIPRTKNALKLKKFQYDLDKYIKLRDEILAEIKDLQAE